MQKPISKDLALTSGSQVWILPDENNSSWHSIIDWYTNALLSKAKHRRPEPLPEPLVQILKNEEIDFVPTTTTNVSVLLASTNEPLPNSVLLRIPYSGDLTEWIHSAHKALENMKYQELRFFLPKHVQHKNALKIWDERQKSKFSATWVEDPVQDQSDEAPRENMR